MFVPASSKRAPLHNTYVSTSFFLPAQSGQEFLGFIIIMIRPSLSSVPNFHLIMGLSLSAYFLCPPPLGPPRGDRAASVGAPN